MGNVCLQSKKLESERILKISNHSYVSCPSKQMMNPCVQNISQNLDTFEEDFFKNEFLLDYQTDFKRNQSTRKVKLGSTLEEINLLNSIQCPSLCHIDDKNEYIPIIISTIQVSETQKLRNEKSKKKVETKKIQPQKNKRSSRKHSAQNSEQIRSILKSHRHTPNSSLSSGIDNKSQRTVTFSFASSKSKNSRSLSPLVMGMQFNTKQAQSKSMSCLQQFPYL